MGEIGTSSEGAREPVSAKQLELSIAKLLYNPETKTTKTNARFRLPGGRVSVLRVAKKEHEILGEVPDKSFHAQFEILGLPKHLPSGSDEIVPFQSIESHRGSAKDGFVTFTQGHYDATGKNKFFSNEQIDEAAEKQRLFSELTKIDPWFEIDEYGRTVEEAHQDKKDAAAMRAQVRLLFTLADRNFAVFDDGTSRMATFVKESEIKDYKGEEKRAGKTTISLQENKVTGGMMIYIETPQKAEGEDAYLEDRSLEADSFEKPVIRYVVPEEHAGNQSISYQLLSSEALPDGKSVVHQPTKWNVDVANEIEKRKLENTLNTLKLPNMRSPQSTDFRRYIVV